jgi:hypothetical protein
VDLLEAQTQHGLFEQLQVALAAAAAAAAWLLLNVLQAGRSKCLFQAD